MEGSEGRKEKGGKRATKQYVEIESGLNIKINTKIKVKVNKIKLMNKIDDKNNKKII